VSSWAHITYTSISQDDAAFVLGKNGSTKKKIARVCGADLDLNEHDLVSVGYVSWARSACGLKGVHKSLGVNTLDPANVSAYASNSCSMKYLVQALTLPPTRAHLSHPNYLQFWTSQRPRVCVFWGASLSPYPTQVLEVYGDEKQRARARDYVEFVTQQRIGPVHIDVTAGGRDDLTVRAACRCVRLFLMLRSFLGSRSTVSLFFPLSLLSLCSLLRQIAFFYLDCTILQPLLLSSSPFLILLFFSLPAAAFRVYVALSIFIIPMLGGGRARGLRGVRDGPRRQHFADHGGGVGEPYVLRPGHGARPRRSRKTVHFRHGAVAPGR